MIQRIQSSNRFRKCFNIRIFDDKKILNFELDKLKYRFFFLCSTWSLSADIPSCFCSLWPIFECFGPYVRIAFHGANELCAIREIWAACL